MGKFQFLEAVLPLGIIAGFLCIAGNIQYTIHKAAHGRPKHIGNDMWDVAMERRDKKIVEEKLSPASQ
uniref:NADH dehydrogenase [ubiquinone] 1 alpha subcomplex subunit 1 n=1 Tax=Erigeron canadensis TaxID=72917 RepID=UPI001CB98492|nr:NADH dehydrogenase [ubiquinone] 1 alpha subcomplex subunit 1 [Erigeron canadensis]